MNSPISTLSRFAAAVGATVIMAVSACAFLSSSAPLHHDPFQFGSIMTGNAKVRVEQWHSRAGSTCPNNPEAWDPLAPVCLRV